MRRCASRDGRLDLRAHRLAAARGRLLPRTEPTRRRLLWCGPRSEEIQWRFQSLKRPCRAAEAPRRRFRFTARCQNSPRGLNPTRDGTGWWCSSLTGVPILRLSGRAGNVVRWSGTETGHTPSPVSTQRNASTLVQKRKRLLVRPNCNAGLLHAACALSLLRQQRAHVCAHGRAGHVVHDRPGPRHHGVRRWQPTGQPGRTRIRPSRAGLPVAPGETVILLHPPLHHY